MAQYKKTISVQTPGSLKDLLGEESDKITHLTVRGKVSHVDIQFASSMPLLTHVNFSEAEQLLPSGKVDALFHENTWSSIKNTVEFILPKGITEIGMMGFYDCPNLEKVVLPPTIKKIGTKAFVSCAKLKYINFPANLWEIKNNAFYGCASLREFVAPPLLRSIGDMAFYNCGLTSVKLSPELQQIGQATFASCKSLERIVVPKENTSFSIGNDGALYSSDLSRLICFPLASSALSYKAPTGLKSADISVFENSSLESIDMGYSIEVLPTSIFAQCEQLKKVYVGSSLKRIMVGIFESSTNLEEFHVASLSVPQVEEYAFYIFKPSTKAKLFVPQGAKKDYEKNEQFYNFFTEISEEDDTVPGGNAKTIYLTEDFQSIAVTEKEWTGNNLWSADYGAYIVSDGSNKYLKLGDNEGAGRVTSKLIHLGSEFKNKIRIRFDFDGWNDTHRSLYIQLLDTNHNPIGTEKVSLYLPSMGKKLRTRDIEFSNVTSDCYVVFYTDDNNRIALIDNVIVYATEAPYPLYQSDIKEVNFGSITVNSVVEPIKLNISAKNLQKRPSIKLISDDIGVFQFDVDWKENNAAVILCNIDPVTVGKYSGYIRVNYQNVNEILIPISAEVIDPNNPFDLDETDPYNKLSEDFEKSTKLPLRWKSISSIPDGRTWSIRTNGINNRYVQINALEYEGTVDAFLILPPINAGELLAYDLVFDMEVVNPNGAKLEFGTLDKNTGNFTSLLDLSKNDHIKGWKKYRFPLSDLTGTVFLAFHYWGENTATMQHTTIYRLDNFVTMFHQSSENVKEINLPYRIENNTLIIEKVNNKFELFSLDGFLLHRGATKSMVLLEKGVYVLRIDGVCYKILL